MRRSRSRRRGRRGAACVVAVALLALVAPAPALALPGVPDLVPDIPGPADLVRAIFEFLLDTFFGVETKVTRRVVEFLVAHPIYSDQARYPELGQLRSYMSAGGWALLTLTITIAAPPPPGRWSSTRSCSSGSVWPATCSRMRCCRRRGCARASPSCLPPRS